MARFVDRPVPRTQNVAQLERYLYETMGDVRLSTDDIYALAQFVLDNFQPAGYGGIGLNNTVDLGTVGLSWVLLPFDSIQITEPKGTTYGINSIALNEPGVWRFNAKVSLQFNDANSGRRIQLSLWDYDGGVAIGPIFNFAVGRNSDGVNLNFNVLFDVSQFIDKPIGLACRGDGDSFSNVDAIGSIFDINYESEYRGEFAIEQARPGSGQAGV